MSQLPYTLRLGFTRAVFTSVALALLVCCSTSAQPGPRAIAIENARVYTMKGAPLENATVLVRGKKILAVGAGLRLPPMGVEKIDGKGKSVTPGLIDARSGVTLLPDALGAGALTPNSRAADSVDPYASHALAETLRSGVTSAYVGPGRPSGFGARGAVFRLKPGQQTSDLLLQPESMLEAGVGLGGSTAFRRIGEIEKMRKELVAARKYRKSWDDYEEALEEYLEKVKERAGKDGDGDEDAKKPEPKKNGKPPGTPGPKGPRKPPEKNAASIEDFQPRRGRPAPSGGAKPEAKKDDEKKEDDLKKPRRPAVNPRMEVLDDLLHGEFALRVEAHRAEDILNALDLAEEFKLRLVLEGCSEGYRVASRIAKAEVPVVLGPSLREPLPRKDVTRFGRSGNAARLVEGGCDVILGSSGRSAHESRFLRAHAALAVSYGLDRDAALSAITLGAARLLGVDDRLGSLEKGKEADLVLYDGDPLDPRSQVELVLVEGEVVYKK